MTRAVLWVVPLAAAVGAWLGGLMDPAPALFTALGLGGITSWAVWSRQRILVGDLARQVNAWLRLTEHAPVEIDGGGHWAELAVAVNAVGAAYHRRGARLAGGPTLLVELVAALPGPALLFTRAGQLATANASGRELFGALDDGAMTVTHALGAPDAIALVEQASADQLQRTTEVSLAGRDLSLVAGPLGGHTLLLASDLTEQRRTEELRRDFVTNASHELKTPVAGIQALSDAIDVTIDTDPDKARRLLAQLRAEADRMGHLVHDLLSLRRLDDRTGGVRVERVDLGRVAQDALAAVAEAAEQRQISVSLTGDDQVIVLGSPDDVRLIVANLVDNGVKYNRAGGEVEVTLVGGSDVVELRVRDTGIGIPRDDVARVFERFYRVDAGRSRQAGGTGLGLSIVRHAVERNGGSVGVESLLGTGTTFIVRLPAAPAVVPGTSEGVVAPS